MTNNNPQQYTIPKDAQILVGEPKDYPTELIEFFKVEFPKMNGIRSAYLAQIFRLGVDQEPGLVLGIDIDSMTPELTSMIGSSLKLHYHQSKNFDVAIIDKADQNSLFKDIKPFYTAI